MFTSVLVVIVIVHDFVVLETTPTPPFSTVNTISVFGISIQDLVQIFYYYSSRRFLVVARVTVKQIM